MTTQLQPQALRALPQWQTCCCKSHRSTAVVVVNGPMLNSRISLPVLSWSLISSLFALSQTTSALFVTLQLSVILSLRSLLLLVQLHAHWPVWSCHAMPCQAFEMRIYLDDDGLRDNADQDDVCAIPLHLLCQWPLRSLSN